MEKNIEITNEHFIKFKRLCDRWLQVFGITEILVNYKHEHLEENYAATFGYIDQKKYWIVLSTEWENEWPKASEEQVEYEIDKLLCECAHHEASEVLFYKIRTLAEDRHISPTAVDEEIHSLIHRVKGSLDRYITHFVKLAEEESEKL